MVETYRLISFKKKIVFKKVKQLLATSNFMIKNNSISEKTLPARMHKITSLATYNFKIFEEPYLRTPMISYGLACPFGRIGPRLLCCIGRL